MSAIGHTMIRASAGSGKTYRLTDRFIRLLELGAGPERIVALTFTRKAAGEFFDDILRKLAHAAEREPERYLPLLRRLIDAMPRLRLGTLDAFFAQIVRAFPFELGLTGDFELLQEHAAHLERRRVLRLMFARPQGGLQAAQQDFVEAFKHATMGAEEKQLARKLDQFLDAHHQVFLSAAAEALWGNPERIWPDGNAWLGRSTDIAAALATLRRWFTAAPLVDRHKERWRDFCDSVEAWTPSPAPPDELLYVLRKALPAIPGLLDGSASVVFDRADQRLSRAAAQALAELALAVVAGEFTRRLAVTRGIRRLLQGYEVFYHDAVRRGGRLTFADVQRLLESGPSLELDYRLDGGIDHWLLDEFQDTSFGQWSILSNLIDEAVQDPEGTRSFFCVGDVKQAIYGWREGDHRLFGDILRRYNSGGAALIREERLDESRRSGPAPIALVNRVFGQPAVIAGLFPESASDEWNREWHPHTTAHPERDGQAALLLAPDEDARWRLTCDLLLEIDPIGRGLSAAVLVQSNDHATELAELLRQEGGLPAVADSDLHVCVDNPVGAALLSLVQLSAHPGDRFAWRHVQMTPLAGLLADRGWTSREAIAVGLTRELQQRGFARALAGWLHRLEEEWPADDRFDRERSRQFVAAAAQFDETGGRSAAEFIEFMERFTLRESESAGVVRVMTIHKAKGLTFDVTILPDLQGDKLAQRRDGLAVQRAANRQVEWILDLPARDFWAHDPVISAHVESQEAAGCYEKLALLYVAMTRARRGVYLVTEPVSPKSTSRNFPKLLAEALGTAPRTIAVGGRALTGVWAEGNPLWFRAIEPDADMPTAQGLTPLKPGATEAPRRRRLVARRPSAEGGTPFGLGAAFGLEPASGAEFGSAVHALFAEIEWAGKAERASRAAEWRARKAMHPAGAADAAADFLLAAANAGIWERPEAGAEVWRERAFEMVVEQAWISGKFDRVVVCRDRSGAPIGATVYDFKTSSAREVPPAERYRGQLDWYRKAAARLTGLPESAVEARIVPIPSR